ncbi:MAG TPA: galactokinase [Pyrinomonadaceae bacterium]|nr:galactokinase [Pyrinomonadaceae bacterium]
MSDPVTLASIFESTYGARPRLFSAPGRVNLIGEHTDYNDGFVLPMAINRRTYVAAAAREDRRVRVRTLDLNDEAAFELDEPTTELDKKWLAYVSGTAWVLDRRHFRLRGTDLMITSQVPVGGGVSSSAALEVSSGKAFVTLAGATLDPVKLALAAQEAENVFVGARVGNMDQLTAALGKKEHALLIDCRSLQVKHIPLDHVDATVVVCNTNIKHELASSAYNQRRSECEEAVEILQRKLPSITALRDLSVDDFVAHENDLPEPIRRRCRHVVTENERTLLAAEAFAKGDIGELGTLMKLSHESLRDDYEVSCFELDTIVELAWSHPAVFGARMTGGGFGGCSVNLVAPAQVSNFCRFIADGYRKATQREADIFIVEADEGVCAHP